ncbi:MAG: DUF4446 family protein [Patescibacteria group bacterium]
MLINLEILQWLFIFLIAWLVSLTVLIVRNLMQYRKFTQNIAKKDLKTLLTDLLNRQESNQQQFKKILDEQTKIQGKMVKHLQKIGFVRFNPFPQTGGDQSFCLSLLDEKDNGFVLSSLHSRDATRFYAKTVKAGQGDGYELSIEEVKAIKNAK